MPASKELHVKLLCASVEVGCFFGVEGLKHLVCMNSTKQSCACAISADSNRHSYTFSSDLMFDHNKHPHPSSPAPSHTGRNTCINLNFTNMSSLQSTKHSTVTRQITTFIVVQSVSPIPFNPSPLLQFCYGRTIFPNMI